MLLKYFTIKIFQYVSTLVYVPSNLFLHAFTFEHKGL